MKCKGSILVADCDSNYRESLINHLLLLGADNVQGAASSAATAKILANNTFELLIVTYTQYIDPEVQSALEIHKSAHAGTVIVMLDDGNESFCSSPHRSIDLSLGVFKSCMKKMLDRFVHS